MLTPNEIKQLLREDIGRHHVDNFFTAVDHLAVVNLPALLDAEGNAEIQKARRPSAT